MADQVLESEEIKLFGTRIALNGRQGKEDHDIKKGREDGGEEEKANKIIACPRCKSMETKFCYFNNYNVNQPRHFCKGCQRYWTAGGALRNVPVGAGRRKPKPPPSHGRGLYESSAAHKLGLDDQGFVLDNQQWDVATVVSGGFRQIFPPKRRRTSSGGQPC